jgi:hypothetical protein
VRCDRVLVGHHSVCVTLGRVVAGEPRCWTQ